MKAVAFKYIHLIDDKRPNSDLGADIETGVTTYVVQYSIVQCNGAPASSVSCS